MGGGPGASKYGVLSHSLCAAAFLALTLFSLWRIMEPLSRVQGHDLRFRVYWCVKCSIYVCLMSFWVSVLHVTNFETLVWAEMGMSTDNIIKPLEYIITCPAMMLIIVVLAGDKVPARRQMEVMGLTVSVLLLGFAAVQTPAIPAKMMFFGSGFSFFLTLLHRVNLCVKQHSDGKESLLSGGPLTGSIYRKLCFKTVATWVLFPAWFLLSPEGLAFVTDKDAATLITAILNIVSKAFFILYVVHIYEDFVSEETLMTHGHKKSSHSEQAAAEAAARLGPAQAIQAMQSNIRSSQECIAKIQCMLNKDAAKKMEAEQASQQRIVQAGGTTPTTGGQSPVEFSSFPGFPGNHPDAPMLSHRSQFTPQLTPQNSFPAAVAPPMSTSMSMPPAYAQQTQAMHGAAPPYTGFSPQVTPGFLGTHNEQMAGMMSADVHSNTGAPLPPLGTQPPKQWQQQQQAFQQPPMTPTAAEEPLPHQAPQVPALPLDTLGSHTGKQQLQTNANHEMCMPTTHGAAQQASGEDGTGSVDADFPMYPEVIPTMQAPVSVCAPVTGEHGQSTWWGLRGRHVSALGPQADGDKQLNMGSEQELDP